jgi:uncharacterized protein (DUF3084 family)
MRQLADLRRRLAAAESALEEAHAARKHAEETYDAAADRFGEAEATLDAAREERAQARTARYAARQAHERASATVDRLQRRVAELSLRLDRAELAATPGSGCVVPGQPAGGVLTVVCARVTIAVIRSG